MIIPTFVTYSYFALFAKQQDFFLFRGIAKKKRTCHLYTETIFIYAYPDAPKHPHAGNWLASTQYSRNNHENCPNLQKTACCIS